MNNYFAEKNVECYLDGLQRWKRRWENCVELQGDFVGKKFSEKMPCVLVRSETFQTTLVYHIQIFYCARGVLTFVTEKNE